ncbi:hypothetical protein GQ53DRAFT_141458 [Thozetella sp. PMI_491]|nr:hypothetical protein GQ53DRAFT_141458 [Thozetella sp. PMI_491]
MPDTLTRSPSAPNRLQLWLWERCYSHLLCALRDDGPAGHANWAMHLPHSLRLPYLAARLRVPVWGCGGWRELNSSVLSCPAGRGQAWERGPRREQGAGSPSGLSRHGTSSSIIPPAISFGGYYCGFRIIAQWPARRRSRATRAGLEAAGETTNRTDVNHCSKSRRPSRCRKRAAAPERELQRGCVQYRTSRFPWHAMPRGPRWPDRQSCENVPPRPRRGLSSILPTAIINQACQPPWLLRKFHGRSGCLHSWYLINSCHERRCKRFAVGRADWPKGKAMEGPLPCVHPLSSFLDPPRPHLGTCILPYRRSSRELHAPRHFWALLSAAAIPLSPLPREHSPRCVHSPSCEASGLHVHL